MKHIILLLLIAASTSVIAQQYPFQDTRLPIDQRVEDLISRLTLDEKLGFMEHQNQPVERLGIPAYSWWNEALHGVARNGKATVYPMPIAMAASFDPGLVMSVYRNIAFEGILKHQEMNRLGRHDDYCGLTFFTPNINIFRDPRWGRGMETFGEDPLLTGEMGLAVVRGLQGTEPGRLRTGACIKHLAVHSGPEGLRHEWDSKIGMRDLFTTYLPAFEHVIRRSDVQQVMCGYNRLNGAPCCANAMLNDILRNRWHYNNILVTDCWAINDMYERDTVIPRHKTHPTAAAASAAAFGTEVDLECGSGLPALKEAVEQGLIPESKIDEHLRRVLRTRMMAELSANKTITAKDIDTTLLDRISRESLVLLKGDNYLLDQRPAPKIAVIGPNATDSTMQWGNYNGEPYHTITIKEGFEKYVSPYRIKEIYFDTACHHVLDDYQRPADFWERIKECDRVVFCGGLSPALEGEELQVELPGFHRGDRTQIELPRVQVDLIHQIHALGKEVTLVLCTGSAIALEEVEPDVEAILVAWYGGERMGKAVAEVCNGNIHRLGRLPVTFYRSTSQMPAYEDYSMANRTYRYMDTEPLYPFGFGLSESRLEIQEHSYDPQSRKLQVKYFLRSRVRDGEHEDQVLQVYVRNLDDPEAPRLSLVAFRRVCRDCYPNMGSAETITLPEEAFYSYDESTESMRDLGHHFEIYAGSSSRMSDLIKVGER